MKPATTQRNYGVVSSSTQYNDARKYCPHCRRTRSIAQYANKDAAFCNQCVRRGAGR